MDYKAAGAPKMGKNKPRYKDGQGHSERRGSANARPGKEELLARMKKAAQGKAEGKA